MVEDVSGEDSGLVAPSCNEQLLKVVGVEGDWWTICQ